MRIKKALRESNSTFNISMTIRIQMNLFGIFYAIFIQCDDFKACIKHSSSKRVASQKFAPNCSENETYLNVCYSLFDENDEPACLNIQLTPIFIEKTSKFL